MPANALAALILLSLSLSFASAGGAPAADDTADSEVARKNHEGVSHLARREYDAAVSLFRECLVLLPGSEPITANLRQALLGRGVHRCNQGEKGAEEDLREALALGPEDAAVLRNLGFCLMRAEKWVDALPVLDRAAAIEPGSADVRAGLGQTLYRLGRLEESIVSLESALKADPGRDDVAALLEKARRENGVESRFAQEDTSFFVVSYDGERENRADVTAILGALEEVAIRVGLDFDFQPTTRVPVLLYSAEEFVAVTNSHTWVGGLFDGKIRVPIKNASSHLPEIRRTLSHEYTHYVVSALSPRAPAWLNEGLAQWEEEPGAPPGAAKLALVVAARDAGKLDRFASLAASFAGIPDKDRVRLLYAQSHAFTAYLVERFGMAKVKDLLVTTKTARSVSLAFEEAFGEPLLAVEEAWRQSL